MENSKHYTELLPVHKSYTERFPEGNPHISGCHRVLFLKPFRGVDFLHIAGVRFGKLFVNNVETPWEEVVGLAVFVPDVLYVLIGEKLRGGGAKRLAALIDEIIIAPYRCQNSWHTCGDEDLRPRSPKCLECGRDDSR